LRRPHVASSSAHVQRFKSLLSDLRAEAARTPPFAANSKKKVPPGINARLEALVRPFYICAETSPNVNRAKRALWAVLLPMMMPWAAENTIKTKMQQFNSRVIGALGLEKENLETVARWVGANPASA
jgi:hypothetical protein